MSDLRLRPGEVCQYLTQHHTDWVRWYLGENDELTTKSKVDLYQLLSCRDSFALHFTTVSYGLANYKYQCSQANLFAPQSLVGTWPRLENDRGGFPRVCVIVRQVFRQIVDIFQDSEGKLYRLCHIVSLEMYRTRYRHEYYIYSRLIFYGKLILK